MLKIHMRVLAVCKATYAILRKPAEWAPWIPVLGVLLYLGTKGREDLEEGFEKWISYHLKWLGVMMLILVIIWLWFLYRLRILVQLTDHLF